MRVPLQGVPPHRSHRLPETTHSLAQSMRRWVFAGRCASTKAAHRCLGTERQQQLRRSDSGWRWETRSDGDNCGAARLKIRLSARRRRTHQRRRREERGRAERPRQAKRGSHRLHCVSTPHPCTPNGPFSRIAASQDRDPGEPGGPGGLWGPARRMGWIARSNNREFISETHPFLCARPLWELSLRPWSRGTPWDPGAGRAAKSLPNPITPARWLGGDSRPASS